MPFDRELGCATPGTVGSACHLGDPLTVAQIRELPDGAEIVVTWDGGNGPHPYRVLVDRWGERRIEGLYTDRILHMGPDQRVPLHRVTLGWDDDARAWVAGAIPEPEHIQRKWRQLRGLEEAA